MSRDGSNAPLVIVLVGVALVGVVVCGVGLFALVGWFTLSSAPAPVRVMEQAVPVEAQPPLTSAAPRPAPTRRGP